VSGKGARFFAVEAGATILEAHSRLQISH